MPDGEHTSPIAAPEKVRELEEVFRRRDVQQLAASASVWMQEAMNAWSDDEYGKVAVLAPLAVEHLGKAVLWQKNPVLVVPLSPDAESSLAKLATRPSLTDPKLRTVGLKTLLGRIETVIGSLPINPGRRNRMVEIRNGAMHVASSETSRHVLIDALMLCNAFLEQLGRNPDCFYGDHRFDAKRLVEEGLSEVQHRVAAKLARARKNLTMLEERLGSTLFQETTDRLEEDAAEAFEGEERWAVDQECPECGSHGRMMGSIDLDRDSLFDDEGDACGFDDWEITMSPSFFGCNVCRLSLSGVQEFAAAGLPTYNVSISADDLGPDFDPEREAERLYGIND